MVKLTRMIAVAALAAAMLAGTAPASHADCVSAEMYVEDSGGNKNYVLGPNECLVTTPWPILVDGGKETGTSSVKVGVWVWIPVPPPPPPPS